MFDNTVKAEWLAGEPRDMRLLETVRFTDSAGKIWEAPDDSIINGASIPKFFWSFIGSPYVGLYRRPTVMHDVYCEKRTETHEATHQMFYEAMLADGMDVDEAERMFRAVRDYGPKWDENGNDLIVLNNEPDYTNPANEEFGG